MNRLFRNKPKRIYLSDHIYFVTSKTFKNQKIFKDENKAKVFMQTMKFLRFRGDFELSISTLLPNHFHLLIKPTKKTISEIMHDLKSYSAQVINQQKRNITTDNQRRGILASPRNDIQGGEAGSLASGKGGDQINISNKTKRRGILASPRGSNRKTTIWQRSFYYHIIDNEDDFFNHYNYIYYNAVKHRYVTEPETWPFLLRDIKEFQF